MTQEMMTQEVTTQEVEIQVAATRFTGHQAAVFTTIPEAAQLWAGHVPYMKEQWQRVINLMDARCVGEKLIYK